MTVACLLALMLAFVVGIWCLMLTADVRELRKRLREKATRWP